MAKNRHSSKYDEKELLADYQSFWKCLEKNPFLQQVVNPNGWKKYQVLEIPGQWTNNQHQNHYTKKTIYQKEQGNLSAILSRKASGVQKKFPTDVLYQRYEGH